MDSKMISRMVDLQEDIDAWYKRIDEATREITEVRQQVEQMVQAAANRFLVNEQGQPVDGALYWWRQMAIVRLGTRLELIPLQTMDEEKIWPNGNDPLRRAQEVPQDTASTSSGHRVQEVEDAKAVG